MPLFLASNGAVCTSLTTTAVFSPGRLSIQILRYNSATAEQTEVGVTQELASKIELLEKPNCVSVQLSPLASSTDCEWLDCTNTSTEVSTEVQMRSMLYCTQAPPFELATNVIPVSMLSCVMSSFGNISMLVFTIASLNTRPTL